ncbi:metallophosphoesterase family protein [Lysinibacillus sp. 54212]|uniref:metallophosphoesterase family protein n=1 Tax=Lysinibacillus sp. 54212 TaxID=3119829 RepID=UPI002FC58157
MNLLIVSDIHGMYKQFEEILRHWDQESILVILGDMIDRGEYSYEVVQRIMSLQAEFPDKVVVLKGNHEDMLMYYIDGKMEDPTPFLVNGGIEMLRSFIKDIDEEAVEQNAEILKTQFAAEIDFLRGARHYFQYGNLLITHAGFDSALHDWQQTASHDFLWIREHYRNENKTGLLNIFGHTPTRNMHETDDIWISPCQTYIGIDGACAYGGQLNALLISEEGEILNTYLVPSEK